MSNQITKRSIWQDADNTSVMIIDQTELPFRYVEKRLSRLEEVVEAIASMRVRGAPLIGISAAYGLAFAVRDEPTDEQLAAAYRLLIQTRPTAVNLRWALDYAVKVLKTQPEEMRVEAAYDFARKLLDESVEECRKIGEHGCHLIREIASSRRSGAPVNILTHCNAGWLATVEWGTALAPIYVATENDIPVHVWVDETRPRNQGAQLTAWELMRRDIPCTVIVDNAGGHLMQHGEVDMCIVGSDRTTACGDVCNKIGTYLKALAAYDNDVPFYAALPSSTIDWSIKDGVGEIEIEQRDSAEVHYMRDCEGSVRLTAPESKAKNFAFDVTPSRLVTGLITERGVCEASRSGLMKLFPDQLSIGS